MKELIERGLVCGCCMIELLMGHKDIIKDLNGNVKKLSKRLYSLALLYTTLMFVSLLIVLGSIGLTIQLLMTVGNFERLLNIGKPASLFVLYALVVYLLTVWIEKELRKLGVTFAARTSSFSECLIDKLHLGSEAKPLKMKHTLNEPVLFFSMNRLYRVTGGNTEAVRSDREATGMDEDTATKNLEADKTGTDTVKNESDASEENEA